MNLTPISKYLLTYGTSFFFSLSFATLSIFLVNRNFGLESVGAWTLFISSIELFRSLDLGVSQLLARTTARLSLLSSRVKVLTSIFSYSLTPLVLYLAIVAFIFYQFYCLPLSSLVKPSLLLFCFLASLVSNLILNFIYNILLGFKLQVLWKSIQSIHYLCRLALLGFFPFFSSIQQLIAFFPLVDVIFCLIIVSWFLLRYNYVAANILSSLHLGSLTKLLSSRKNSLLRYSFFAFLMTLVGRGSSQLDSLFVINMLGTDSAALLEISTKIGLSFGMVTSLISHWIFPRTTKKGITAFGSESSSRQIIRIIASLSFLASLMLATCYAYINQVFSRDAVLAAFAYSTVLLVNVTLCIESLIVAHSSSHGPKRIFLVDSLSLIINLPLTFYLISEYGWVGAPLATAFSVIFISAPLLSLYYHQISPAYGFRRWSQALYSFKMHKSLPIHLGIACMIFIDAAPIQYLLCISIIIEFLNIFYVVQNLMRGPNKLNQTL